MNALSRAFAASLLLPLGSCVGYLRFRIDEPIAEAVTGGRERAARSDNPGLRCTPVTDRRAGRRSERGSATWLFS